MSKEKVKEMNGVFASVFAHAGHITKEEAQEISGLADEKFEKAYSRAADISSKVMQFEGNKMDHFIEHYAKLVDEYMEHFGGKLFH
jgi:hypothetical protein